jgi:hypothetical protein
VNSRENRYGSLRGQIVPVPAIAEPVTGGVYGQSLVTYYTPGILAPDPIDGPPFPQPPPPVVWTPYKAWVSIYGANGQLVTRVISNPVGQFYSYLKPGDYILLATSTDVALPPRNLSDLPEPGPGNITFAPTVNVTVASDQWTQTAINFETY